MENQKGYWTTSISDGQYTRDDVPPGSLVYDTKPYWWGIDKSGGREEARERIHMRWMFIVVAVIVLILLCTVIAAIVVVVVVDKGDSSDSLDADGALCRSRACRSQAETSTPKDGAPSPKYPLSFDQFRRYVAPNKMREFFYFSKLCKPDPCVHLRRLVVTWLDMGNGTYQNTFVARFPESICINQTSTPLGTPITLTPVGDGTASFRFLNFDGTSNIYMGHIFSACPEKYFFNWYCPEKFITPAGYCRQNALMDLVFTADVPDHLPWQTIVTDLYNNTGLFMDDERWTLTFRGESCETTA